MDVPHYWTADQIQRLLDALASHNRHQARTAALIMWRTGLWISEILELEWRDLDYSGDPQTWDVVTAASGAWNMEIDRNGRMATAFLCLAVEEGRIEPTARIYQSEWNQMMAATDPMARLRMIDSMLLRIAAPTRHYNERTARLRALRDEVAKQVNEAMDIGPSSSAPLMPDA